VPQVRRGQLVHVVRERLNAEDTLRIGVHRRAGMVGESPQRRNLADRRRRTAWLDADVLDGASVGADEPGERCSRERVSAGVHRHELRRGQRVTRECQRPFDGGEGGARLQARLDRLEIVGVRPDRGGELEEEFSRIQVRAPVVLGDKRVPGGGIGPARRGLIRETGRGGADLPEGDRAEDDGADDRDRHGTSNHNRGDTPIDVRSRVSPRAGTVTARTPRDRRSPADPGAA